MIHQFHENKKLLTNSLSLTIFFGGVALPGLLYGIVCLWPLVMMPHHQISGGSPDHLQTRTASGQKQLLEAPGVVSQRWNLPVNPRQWSDIHDCKPFFFCFFFSKFQKLPQKFEVHNCWLLFLGIFLRWILYRILPRKTCFSDENFKIPPGGFSGNCLHPHIGYSAFRQNPSFCRSSGGGRAELHRETRQM